MIMGLEGSGMAITSDSIKMKLLQEVKSDVKFQTSDSGTALVAKSNHKYKFKKKGPRCYQCNQFHHYPNNCSGKKNSKSGEGNSKAFFAMAALGEATEDSKWYLNSCASSHMTSNSKWLEQSRQSEGVQISTADNSKTKAKMIGNMKVPVLANGCPDEVIAKDILYVPKSPLFSCL
ncbi:uncharacterized protein LOC123315691 [Coccinella septempunctata]|uniref:uncharacterized protein LOC123315691 n=1 Tax=Coccinella septempunctata TaxID=41139 RepID=UPI001D092635|nr:uncharacterized protein LOC123315691 [Coccinella septempunctata]